MRKLFALAALALLIFTGCGKDKTRYEIRYCFDNTAMQSDFLEAYELNPDGTANGIPALVGRFRRIRGITVVWVEV